MMVYINVLALWHVADRQNQTKILFRYKNITFLPFITIYKKYAADKPAYALTNENEMLAKTLPDYQLWFPTVEDTW